MSTVVHSPEISCQIVEPYTVSVWGWKLAVFADNEAPAIQDIELASKLGYKRPRDIRKLIKRLIEERKLSDVFRRAIVARRGFFEAEIEEYWLNEPQALKLIAKSETEIADTILDEMIAVFIRYRTMYVSPLSKSAAPISYAEAKRREINRRLKRMAREEMFQKSLPEMERPNAAPELPASGQGLFGLAQVAPDPSRRHEPRRWRDLDEWAQIANWVRVNEPRFSKAIVEKLGDCPVFRAVPVIPSMALACDLLSILQRHLPVSEHFHGPLNTSVPAQAEQQLVC